MAETSFHVPLDDADALYKAFFPQKIIKKRRKVAAALLARKAPASNRGYPPFGSCCNDPSFPMLRCLITDNP